MLTLVGAISGCECRHEVAHPPTPSSASVTNDPGFRALRAAVLPLHERKPPPAPGEWLAQHAEPGQTFDAYRQDNPVLPDGEHGPRRLLYVQSLGGLSLAHAGTVENVVDYLPRFFGLEVRERPALPLSLIPPHARRMREGTRQLSSAFILRDLLAPRLPPDAAAYISFTTEDLWPGEGWSFVFGQASLQARVGVWSMHRYSDPHRGPGSQTRLLRRTLRVAVHEIAHMFSLEHCTAYACVMNGSNGLEEADRGPLWLCPECLAKVLWATGQDAETRFERLAEFAEIHGLKREASFFEQSATAVGRSP